MATVASLLVRIGSDVTDFERGIDQASGRLQKVGQSFTAVGGILTKAVTVPLLGISAGSLKAAIDFESSFAEVIKTVDATDAQFQQLEKSFRGLSKEIPVNVNEINRVAAAAGQLGIETENIVGFTETMLALGVTTNLSAEQAATSLARLANITQLPQSEFDRLGSTIVDLGNNLATTEAEIVSMGLRIAGAGKQVGLTQDQILGFAGALSSVGIEAEAGGTAISRVMLDIQKAVGEGGESLQTIARISGMTADQFKQSFEQDAALAITSFITGLGQMQTEGQNVVPVLDELGFSGIRVRDALLRLAGSGDTLTNALNIATKAWAENTALTAEAETRYGTTASQIQIFINRVRDAAITLGKALLPVLIETLNFLEPFINIVQGLALRFATLSPIVQRIIIAFGALLAAAGPVLIIAGQLTTAITALGPVFSVVSGAVGGFSGVLAAITGPVGITIAAIVALGAAISKAANFIIDNWDNLRAAGGELFVTLENTFKNIQVTLNDSLGTIIMDIQNLITTVRERWNAFWGDTGATLVNTWDSMAAFLGPVLDAFSRSIGAMVDSIIPIWETLKTTFLTLVDIAFQVLEAMRPLLELLGGAFLILTGVAIGALNGIIAALGPFLDTVANVVNILVSTLGLVIALIRGDWAAAWDFLVDIGESTLGALQGLVQTILNLFGGFIDGIVGFFQGLFNALVGGSLIPDLVNGILMWFTNLSAMGLQLITTFVTNLIQMANELVMGMISFISELPGKVATIFTNTLNTGMQLWNTIKSTLMSLAAQTIDGIVNFFSQTASRTGQTVSQAFVTLQGKWNNVKAMLRQQAATAINGIVSFFSQTAARTGATVSATFTTLKTKWTNVRNMVVNMALNILNGVVSKFAQVPGKVGATISRLFNVAKTKLINVRNMFFTQFNQLVSGVKSRIFQIPNFISTLSSRVLSRLKTLGRKLLREGKRIASNLWSGFKSKLGIRSPSFIERAFIAIENQADDSLMAVRRMVPGFNTDIGRLLPRELMPMRIDRAPVPGAPGTSSTQTMAAGQPIMFNQNINTEARPEQIQRVTERALRKIAIEWGVE